MLFRSQPAWKAARPNYVGMTPAQHGIYDKAWNTFQKEMATGSSHAYVPRSISDYYDTKEWDAAAKDFNSQLGGYARGGSYTGTWNGNQGFDVGGAYIPDYASSAYGLPQFEMGAPIYADGGMSPDQAMMMQQQAAPQQSGGGMDQQQQVVQAIMQMLQQGMDPNQIMQQLVQAGLPQQVAQQLLQAVIQQVQGGGQEGMGGGQPNGVQQPIDRKSTRLNSSH